ncbi:MAG: hypothetical protein LUD81_07915 [Clostridiales bacterium]|nr:hypothetical protein [Clostridiales bacterium]
MKEYTNEEIKKIYEEAFADFEADLKLKNVVEKVDEIRFDLEQAVADVAHAAEKKSFVEGFKVGMKKAGVDLL